MAESAPVPKSEPNESSPIIIEGITGPNIPISEPSTDCPITKEDIKHFEGEIECFDKAKGWKMLKKTEFAEVWQKSDGSPIPLIKGILFLPDIPLAKVLELVLNFNIRLRFDKRYIVLEEVERHGDYKTVYWVVQTPPGTGNRDFVLNMFYGVNNGVYCLVGKGTTHPKKPEVPGIVRGETILTGIQLYVDKDDPNSTRVNLLLQDDIKGYIPKFLSNSFYRQAPIEWRDSLYKFYHDVYKHEKNEK